MNKFYRSTCVSVMLLLMCMVSYAQQRVVTGTIKDPAGIGLPGVNVLVKGTTNGATTDVEGAYFLNASQEDVLVISFIGYQTQEVAVGSQTIINVILTE